MKLSYIITGIVVVVLIVVGVVFVLNRSNEQTVEIAATTPPLATIPTQSPQVSTKTFTFNQQKKAAHFETSTPTHQQVLAAVPMNVVIDFNFDLAVPSEISIKNNDKEYGQGETTIDGNKLSLRRAVDPSAPDGIYNVVYKACWPDKSCHDGAFSFAVDRSLAAQYSDMTNQKEITIHMSGILFNHMNIKISKGTKVTWVNDDQEIHYVNTDSHPAHTYFTAQNSKALQKGDSYSVAFDTVGAYPYHCSAHAGTMVGSIIVV